MTAVKLFRHSSRQSSQWSKRLSTTTTIPIRSTTSTITTSINPDFVDLTSAPSHHDPHSVAVYPSIITPAESTSLLSDIEPRLKRRRYEKGHWDSVITGYKEIEFSRGFLRDDTVEIIDRLRSILERDYDVERWLPCHVIDLKKEGELNAHVDSVRFSGGIVAGLSLVSSSVMRLKPAVDDDDDDDDEIKSRDDDDNGDNVDNATAAAAADVNAGHVDLYLPPLSLYVLSGVSRFKYTHELLPSGVSFCDGGGNEFIVPRGRRISIIFRDAKKE